jgi:hypothetical protein
MFRVACIVEGHADTEAVPLLIRRIAREIANPPVHDVEVIVTDRISLPGLEKSGELERAVEFAARKVAGKGAILILVDCEDQPPCLKGPELLRRAQRVHSDMPIGVVLAYREFETWFLTAAVSLRNQRGLPTDLEPPTTPEAIRDAKGWLSSRMAGSYRATLHQPAFTARFDLSVARRSDSFDKCCREVLRLLEHLRCTQPEATS